MMDTYKVNKWWPYKIMRSKKISEKNWCAFKDVIKRWNLVLILYLLGMVTVYLISLQKMEVNGFRIIMTKIDYIFYAMLVSKIDIKRIKISGILVLLVNNNSNSWLKLIGVSRFNSKYWLVMCHTFSLVFCFRTCHANFIICY